MRRAAYHPRSWQTHAGKPERAIPAVSREEIRLAALKGPKPVPSKLTIKRIKKSKT